MKKDTIIIEIEKNNYNNFFRYKNYILKHLYRTVDIDGNIIYHGFYIKDKHYYGG